MIKDIIDLLSYIFVMTGIIMFIYSHLKARKNSNLPIKKDTNRNFAILIPARYESKVIENLIISIKNQTVPVNMSNVYVIVESEKDETINILKKYDVNIFIRKELDKKTKGYALNEVIKDILNNNKHYDAYFIFDADNILKNNYMEEIIKTFDKGYDIGMGYRNLKNKNPNVISVCSFLTFSMLNNISNDFKKKYSCTMTLSGTGFYIRGNIIEKLKGYPFNSLTEDYELTLYANLNNFTSYYNKDAEFFDEQPIKFKETLKQRIRWIRGYFDCRKEYIKKIKGVVKLKDKNYGDHIIEIIGVKPYIFSIVGILMYIINQIVYMFINTGEILELITNIFKNLLFLYSIMSAITFALLAMEKDKVKIDIKVAIKTILFNPIYLASYIYCAIIAITKKEITWDRIDHNLN